MKYFPEEEDAFNFLLEEAVNGPRNNSQCQHVLLKRKKKKKEGVEEEVQCTLIEISNKFI